MTKRKHSGPWNIDPKAIQHEVDKANERINRPYDHNEANDNWSVDNTITCPACDPGKGHNSQ